MDNPNPQSSLSLVQRDVSEPILISPYGIYQYFNNLERPIREGTELLNAGWVHAIGIAPSPVKNWIMGLIVQTSSITSKPHEVLDFLNQSYKKWKCVCSCKAGNGEKCKHIAACLLHINTLIHNFDILHKKNNKHFYFKNHKREDIASAISINSQEVINNREERAELFLNDGKIERQDKHIL